jgi:hypothetical protein
MCVFAFLCARLSSKHCVLSIHRSSGHNTRAPDCTPGFLPSHAGEKGGRGERHAGHCARQTSASPPLHCDHRAGCGVCVGVPSRGHGAAEWVLGCEREGDEKVAATAHSRRARGGDCAPHPPCATSARAVPRQHGERAVCPALSGSVGGGSAPAPTCAPLPRCSEMQRPSARPSSIPLASSAPATAALTSRASSTRASPRCAARRPRSSRSRSSCPC